MKSISKPRGIVLLAAVITAVICIGIIFHIRNGIGQGVPQNTTAQASSSVDENKKIREAIAEDFLEKARDGQSDVKSDYEPLTLPPDGETFSFSIDS